MYKLKKGREAFEVVDGPMAGRRFVPGKKYAEIPPMEAVLFEKIKQAAPAKAKAPEADKS
jgi:hypothetical protein